MATILHYPNDQSKRHAAFAILKPTIILPQSTDTQIHMPKPKYPALLVYGSRTYMCKFTKNLSQKALVDIPCTIQQVRKAQFLQRAGKALGHGKGTKSSRSCSLAHGSKAKRKKCVVLYGLSSSFQNNRSYS